MNEHEALGILEKAISYNEDGSCKSGSWILGPKGIEAVKIAIMCIKKSLPLDE